MSGRSGRAGERVRSMPPWGHRHSLVGMRLDNFCELFKGADLHLHIGFAAAFTVLTALCKSMK